MIKMVRLDERLIHGQVATKWSKILDVDRILVADDMSAGNETIKKSLMMAAPADRKTLVTTMEGAIKLCNDPRSEKLKILLIVSTPDNLLKIVKEVHGIAAVNIGNYGRIAEKQNGMVRRSYTSNLYLYDSEADILKQVLETGLNCNVQTIPDDQPRSLKSIIEIGG